MELSFHTGVEDTLAHTRQLLLKAMRRGWAVAVVGSRPMLAPLDRYLWVADPQDFLPHQVSLSPDVSDAESGCLRSPVLLVESPAGWPRGRAAPGLVVDLQAAELPPEASSSASGSVDETDATVDWSEWSVTHRIQVVGVSPQAVRHGRGLWRQAQQQGLNPRHVNRAA